MSKITRDDILAAIDKTIKYWEEICNGETLDYLQSPSYLCDIFFNECSKHMKYKNPCFRMCKNKKSNLSRLICPLGSVGHFCFSDNSIYNLALYELEENKNPSINCKLILYMFTLLRDMIKEHKDDDEYTILNKGN